jgi:hypothetical protein
MAEDNTLEPEISPAKDAAPAEETDLPEVIAHSEDEEEGPETAPWCVSN